MKPKTKPRTKTNALERKILKNLEKSVNETASKGRAFRKKAKAEWESYLINERGLSRSDQFFHKASEGFEAVWLKHSRVETMKKARYDFVYGKGKNKNKVKHVRVRRHKDSNGKWVKAKTISLANYKRSIKSLEYWTEVSLAKERYNLTTKEARAIRKMANDKSFSEEFRSALVAMYSDVYDPYNDDPGYDEDDTYDDE